MGVDDEYNMVSSQEDVNDSLLERATPITRASYRKRNMFASVAVGAFIGAALTFLFSLIFTPQGYSQSISTTPEADTVPAVVAPEVVTMTVTHTAPPAVKTVTIPSLDDDDKFQAGVDKAHLVPHRGVLDCGNTVEEAKAKDCVFDVMMQDWMPRVCHDEALSERYLANGNWTWWADAEATQTLSLEQMRKGEHPVIYVIQDYHKAHCIYAWEKAIRALRNDWPLIEELISYDHIMHCRHSTLSKHSEEVRGVRAPTAWTRCAVYKDWQGNFPANSVSSIDKRSLDDGWTLF